MGTDTTARQNTIIWSATGALIILLLGIIGWLINGKDTSLTNSIKGLVDSQSKYMEKAEESDHKIMDAFQKLCERVGGVENRVGNLEIYIQMPYSEREKYLPGGRKK